MHLQQTFISIKVSPVNSITIFSIIVHLKIESPITQYLGGPEFAIGQPQVKTSPPHYLHKP